jgi:hypothetical protein
MQTKATAEQLTPEVFEVFRRFINQRAGLDPRNYFSDWRDKDGHRAYRAEARSIQADGKRARRALETALLFPFTPENAAALIDATHAFSGRLQIVFESSKGIAIDYCTGQYWPTEYRKAAATVLKRYVEDIRPKQKPGGRIPETVAELKDMNRAAGGHFFDRDSMRCFRSRVLPNLYAGNGKVYFLTSEANYDGSARAFTVRVFDPATGDVDTFGEFNKWTRGAALGIARQAARSPFPICRVCGGEGTKHGQECWQCKGTRREVTAVVEEEMATA